MNGLARALLVGALCFGPPALARDDRPLVALGGVVSRNDLVNQAGPFPLRFNGANKILLSGGRYYLLSPEGRYGAYRHRIFARRAAAVGDGWSLLATLAGPMDCRYDARREAPTRTCRIRQFYTYTGAAVRDAEGYLHLFEFAAVDIGAWSNTTRLVHLKSTQPLGDQDRLEFSAHVQPPSVSSAYAAGVVTATYDAGMRGIHLAYWGAPTQYASPDHDERFRQLSRDRVRHDPYREPTGDLYRATALSYAFLADRQDFLPAPQLLVDSVPRSFDSREDLGQDAAFVAASGGRVTLLQSDKYPFLIRRRDDLVLATVVNVEKCTSLRSGKACSRGKASVERPVQPHVNVNLRTYRLARNADEVALQPVSEQLLLPTPALERLPCRAQLDLFDAVLNARGEVLLALVRTEDPTGAPGCGAQSRVRSIAVLTASNELIRDAARVDASGLDGVPCLMSSTRGIDWLAGFLPGGQAQLVPLDARGRVPAGKSPGESRRVLPAAGEFPYFTACLNDRAQPLSGNAPAFAFTFVDGAAGQTRDLQRGSSVAWVDLAPEPAVPHAGRGVLDAVRRNPDGSTTLSGWACVRFMDQSTRIQVHAGGAAGSGTPLGTYAAAEASEPQVARACNANGTAYRFRVTVDPARSARHRGEPVFIHARSRRGVGALLDNSGAWAF